MKGKESYKMKKSTQLVGTIVMFIVLIRGTGHVYGSPSGWSADLTASVDEVDGDLASLGYAMSQFSQQINNDQPTTLRRVFVEEHLHKKLVSTNGKCKRTTKGVAQYLVNEAAGETRNSFVVELRIVHKIEIKPCLTEILGQEIVLGNLLGKKMNETQDKKPLHPHLKERKNRKRIRRNAVVNAESFRLNEIMYFLKLEKQKTSLLQRRLENASVAEQIALRQKAAAENLAQKLTKDLKYQKDNVNFLNEELLKLKREISEYKTNLSITEMKNLEELKQERKLMVQLINKINGKNDTAIFEPNMTINIEELKKAMTKLDAERRNSAAVNETGIECENGQNCNMASNKTRAILDGQVDKITAVAFSATRTQTYDKIKTFVPYDNIKFNVGNGLNGTTGLFTAPERGIYFISFAGTRLWNTTILSVELKHNNVALVKRIISGDPSDPVSNMKWITLNLQSTLLMEVGDTVGVHLNDGALYDRSRLLLQEDVFLMTRVSIDPLLPITTGNTVFTGHMVQRL